MHRAVVGIRGRAVGLAVACLLAACTTESAPTDESTTTIPEASTLLRVASVEWPACVNPLLCADDATRGLVLQHVLPVLLEVDGDGGYRPSPVLAGAPQSEVDPETRQHTITYRLAEAARWHDGRPITSTDVLGTWHAIMRTPGADRRGYDRIISVDDADPGVAVVTLDAPYADWRELFGGYRGFLLRADDFGDDADLTGEFDTTLPFGAGPYELVSMTDDAIILTAVDDHWSPERRAEIDQIRIERLAPGAQPTAGVDVWIPAGGSRAVAPGLEPRTARTTRVLGIWFDQRTPALQDVAVRAALDEILDRRDLIGLVAAPRERASVVTCLGWLPSDVACGADLVERDRDLGAADFLLSIAGWGLGPDGVRSRDGEPLILPLTYDPANARYGGVADAIRLSLGAVGVQVAQAPVDRASWASPARVDSTGIGVFAVELGTPGRAAALYDCTVQPNVLGWCDPEVGVLTAQVRASTEVDAQRGAASRLGSAVAGAVPWLPLHQIGRPWHVASDRVVVPERQPLGSGPLGALYDFSRVDN